jgi:replicative DNA helicase
MTCQTYLSLVRGTGKDLYEQTSRVARGIKDLAKESNVPIIFLSQVTKQFTEYDELQINSARDSGSVDEASDFVLALWKEKDKRDEQPDIPQMLGILKNRKGGLGKIKIEMDKRSLKILERGSDVI